MKKAFLMFCMAMSLFATNAFAQLQEVRGVETRRVEYTGNFYQNGKIHTANTTMYGWEFHNANSIKVSVDIELCYTDNKGEEVVAATKSITLKPDETYVLKKEDSWSHYKADKSGENHELYIKYYYVKYKAYKLQ